VSDDAIQALRRRIIELDRLARQLDQSGLDNARAQLLLSRKRAELEDVICRRKDERAASVFPRQR